MMVKGSLKKINKDHLKHLFIAAQARLRETFLHRYRSIALLIVCVMVMGGGAALISVFAGDNKIYEESVTNQELDTAAMDNLELWLENRQTAYENPPVIPASAFND